MKLSKELIQDFHTTVEHYLDNGDLDPSKPEDQQRHQQLTEALNILTNPPRRFAIELRRVELVPESTDPIINLTVKEIMSQYEYDEDPTDLECALWEYLHKFHNFDVEEHSLERCHFEEAISYAIITAGIKS